MTALRRKDVPIQRLCVALVGHNLIDMEIAPVLKDCAGSLDLYIGDDVRRPAVALAGLLTACRNISYLRVSTTSIRGLATQLEIPLLRLRHVDITMFGDGLPAHELADLLKLMPNLRRAALLPRVSDPLQGPDNMHLEYVYITYGYGMETLPLLISRQWTARTVEVRISLSMSNFLERIDWTAAKSLPETTSLCVHMQTDYSGELTPAPALRLIALYPALRSLQLETSGADMCYMLPRILRNCSALQRLDLTLWPSSTGPEHVLAVAELLRGALPTLKTLRMLDISASRYVHLLADLVLVCRRRRVACSVQ